MEEFPLKRKSDLEVLRGRAFPSFRMLSEDEAQKMLSMSRLRKYQPGEVLFKEGEVDPNIYFIIQGHVALAKGDEIHALRRRRGDFIGNPKEVLSPREESAVVKEETTCLALDTTRFVDLDKETLLAFHYFFYRASYPL